MENKNEWKKVKLKEVVEFIDGDRGSNYPTTGELTKEGYCLFLNAKNVTNFGFKFDDNKFISKEKDDILKKGKLKIQDIIITTRGTVGNVAIFTDDIPYKNIRINSGMVILRIFNNEKLLNIFLYQILKSKKIKEKISNLKTGTAQPQLPISTLKEIVIELPRIKVQKKIIKILSAIDNKIELNNKINDNLEKQIRCLYESWFIKFKPFKEQLIFSNDKNIPKDWKIMYLKDVTKNIKEKVKNNNYPVLSAINTGKLCLSEEFFTKQVFSKDIKNYIITKTNNFAYNPARINIGSIGINDLEITGCVSPVYIVVEVEKDYHHFFNLFFKSQYFKKEVTLRASGSVRQTLNYQDFGLIKIVYPTLDVIKKFNKLYLPLYLKIKMVEKENEKLINLKNYLLPKLMNGEIDVENIEL